MLKARTRETGIPSQVSRPRNSGCNIKETKYMLFEQSCQVVLHTTLPPLQDWHRVGRQSTDMSLISSISSCNDGHYQTGGKCRVVSLGFPLGYCGISEVPGSTLCFCFSRWSERWARWPYGGYLSSDQACRVIECELKVRQQTAEERELEVWHWALHHLPHRKVSRPMNHWHTQTHSFFSVSFTAPQQCDASPRSGVSLGPRLLSYMYLLGFFRRGVFIGGENDQAFRSN